MTELLDSQLVYDLRDVINKTDIFVKDPIEKEKFDLICAIMDRFDLSVDFLNKHQSFPKDENEFINFLVHVSIIRDGINAVFKELGLEIKSDNKIFEEYYKMDLPNINKTIMMINFMNILDLLHLHTHFLQIDLFQMQLIKMKYNIHHMY